MNNYEDLKFNGSTCILDISDPNDYNRLALLGRAIYAPARIEIVNLLYKKPMLLSEIAEALDMPISSAAFHLKVLREAHLIGIDHTSTSGGALKWYTYTFPEITILMKDTRRQNSVLPEPFAVEIGVGEYIDAQFTGSCGMASDTALIMECSPQSVFIPERRNAQLVWNKGAGSVTYALPNDYAEKPLDEINFSLELCSEATGYNHAYKSDVTFWINGVELCTYTSPGDFGNRYGRFTPPWWFAESTKYGLMTAVAVRKNGVYLNERLVNKDVTLSSLDLADGNRTTLKIGVKPDAENVGGFNLFGEKFGDYDQAIKFNAIFERIKM